MAETIGERLQRVREEIEEARRHSLTGEEVQLIAVTKTHPVSLIREALAAGVTDIGENKVQELTGKIEEIGPQVRYHMIGNLQSNKVKYIYENVALIHSLDRRSLGKEIEKRAAQTDTTVSCLLQVNIGREPQKGGVDPDDAIKLVESLQDFQHIHLKGLMCVAPNTEDEGELRNCFRNMVKIREQIQGMHYDRVDMDILSMGMSHDFPIAIQEGSNMVRIGSHIFGARNYNK
ncbi:MAG: YggS family pyridoxal phosphate-dependent enzyme [Tissierellia bacterium]|nr:YggS family pyridoxal phosphate-dependent enzyme [Tissierellia bacterium]